MMIDSRMHPNHIEITVAIVKFKTPMGRWRHGVCSTWLAGLEPNSGEHDYVQNAIKIHLQDRSIVPIWVKPGTIRLPKDPETPIIMVGPGTGCAVFRAFIEYRKWLLHHGIKVGKTCFFFGCRSQQNDYLHKYGYPL
jgi:sulfite reductase alpha subunit-like flavoprotein